MGARYYHADTITEAQEIAQRLNAKQCAAGVFYNIQIFPSRAGGFTVKEG